MIAFDDKLFMIFAKVATDLQLKLQELEQLRRKEKEELEQSLKDEKSKVFSIQDKDDKAV